MADAHGPDTQAGEVPGTPHEEDEQTDPAGAQKRSVSTHAQDREPPPLPPPKDDTPKAGDSPDLASDDVSKSDKTQLPPIQIEAPTEDTPSSSTVPSSSIPSSTTPPSRPRSDSQSTSATNDVQRSSTRTSLVFVISALETIQTSKDAQRHKALRDLTEQALNAIRNVNDPNQIDPKVLFNPLRVATEEASADAVVVTALDCIGKLISYSYFSASHEQGQDSSTTTDSLIDQAIDTICNCFEGEATSDRVQLQIIISLLAAVLNDKVIVHGAGLLKAVRQMYNIFLHSKNTRNQQVAQGTLTQMVGTVFERAKGRINAKEARLNLSKTLLGKSPDLSTDRVNGSSTGLVSSRVSSEAPEPDEQPDDPIDHAINEKDGEPKITLKSFERRDSFDKGLTEGPTMVTRIKGGPSAVDTSRADGDTNGSAEADQNGFSEEDDEDEVYMKDAFLVFRAMCKISIKPLRPEEVADPKSQGMRTKLLSLHIIHSIIFNNTALFLSPAATIRGGSGQSDITPFTTAVKQLLCQSLSRNGASSVNKVFEVGCEIFWMMLKHLRVLLKKEIEVFLKEIYLAILDNRHAPSYQKQCFFNVLERLVADPRALVEVYLNYDCDRTASDNMFQRIIEHLSRVSSTPVPITSIQAQTYAEKAAKKQMLQDWQTRGTVPPSLTAITAGTSGDFDPAYPMEFAMKNQSLDCIVEALRSLVHWTQQALESAKVSVNESDAKPSVEDSRESSDIRALHTVASPYVTGAETPPLGTPLVEDDPMQLREAKQRKTMMLNTVKQFNYKPKKGLKALIAAGFIRSDSPDDIARFLLTNEMLDKAALGELLGEGDPEYVTIMHAFVDAMDFTRTRFVDALRRFLQSFRLPGEAQKIDRLMLKFAERYILGNPNAFANADTAYVLAYSVIMLNTDQHSSKMKGRRMTHEDFIKNNRGINDTADLPEDYLRGIFDEIAQNEIVLNTERETAANMGLAAQPASGGIASGLGQAFANVGRDLLREAYMQRAEEMTNKTEQLFKSLMRAQKKTTTKDDATKFIPATSFKHIGPMFDVTWMSFLTALSGCAQNTNNPELLRLCMDGMRLAVQISCMFDLESPRQAFVSTIARLTNLYNLSEMQTKNVEALRVLLDVAYSEGNLLKESWRDVLTCISQLDRFQLISEGVPERNVPDVLKAQPSHKSTRSKGGLQVPQRGRQSNGSASTNYRADIAEEARGSEIVNGVDRIFTSTSRLSGEAIVEFVKALAQVSWQEIESSGQSQDPRTYSLQKLVEVSGYNMDRVRFEWSNIWQVLGDHFNHVGCNANTKVVHFALNSLRQLSMRFLDLEELPGFKFQKDFLKPFEQIMGNTTHVQVKELVLHSLVQMIQARGENIRSGWRTIFSVFTVAARERFEGVVTLAYDNVIQVYNTRLGIIMTQGALADFVVCLTEFSKNARFQKKSLQAIETLKGSIPKMLKTPECPLSAQPASSAARQPSRQTQEEQYWFPVLFAFHDVLMTGDDLEVRSRALNYLFESLTRYGGQFPQDFWDTIWRQLLYPIFMVLKSKSEMTKMVNHEELAVWLSTTMIQALRNIMSLFTHFFESLEYMLDRFLDLLALCICQENDTLARIGSNCLQSLIMSNVDKFTPSHWSQIVGCFVDLFNRTEATSLFSAAVASSYSSSSAPVNGNTAPPVQRADSATVTNLELSDEHKATRRPSDSFKSESRPRRPSPLPNGHAPSPGPASPAQPSTPGLEDYRQESTLQTAPVVVTAARRRFFNQIITKCVLQLLMIETVNELFSNDKVYARIPSDQLLRLMGLLKKSYHFAKRFNDDLELRNRLYAEGFMKQPPNLLKQESGSASVYVNILFRMYHDEGEERRASREQTEAALVPLCADIIRAFAVLSPETQHRNIVTWRPVVVDVIEGYANFPQDGFAKHASTFAPLMPQLMGREMGTELQRSVQIVMHRVLEQHYDMPSLEGWVMRSGTGLASAGQTPSSPRATVFGSRRTSRAGSIAGEHTQ